MFPIGLLLLRASGTKTLSTRGGALVLRTKPPRRDATAPCFRYATLFFLPSFLSRTMSYLYIKLHSSHTYTHTPLSTRQKSLSPQSFRLLCFASGLGLPSFVRWRVPLYNPSFSFSLHLQCPLRTHSQVPVASRRALSPSSRQEVSDRNHARRSGASPNAAYVSFLQLILNTLSTNDLRTVLLLSSARAAPIPSDETSTPALNTNTVSSILVRN